MTEGKINILLLGGGGRESAIAMKLAESRIVNELHCAPGNPGMRGAVLHAADITNARAVVDLCRANGISLVVCGPEAPLVAGVGDAVREAGVAFFGPGGKGAALEGSKIFAKLFMQRRGIPTAAFDVCETMDQCRDAMAKRRPPYVIKADGLAAGKGVFLPYDEREAELTCASLIVERSLGDAGARLVIEDFTPGLELSMFAITDGEHYELLAPSRDHKRAYDGDEGPNTGGMGAYAPVTLPAGAIDKVVSQVLEPTLAGLRDEGIEYRGALYMGLMLTPDGGISVVEYNARLGDPETQAVLPLYDGDLGEVMLSAARGEMAATRRADAPKKHSLAVVLASGGYPGPFECGHVIGGLDDDLPDTFVFHAGTKRVGDDIVTDGGRVLAAVGIGSSLAEAKRRAYDRAAKISFDGMRYRRDIGWSEE